jgi:hypothetical protein
MLVSLRAAVVCVDEFFSRVDRLRFYDARVVYNQWIGHSPTSVVLN